MATALKLRRGTTVQHSTFTGAEGEVTVDTTKDTLVVHDNATAGGFPVVTETGTQTLTNKALNGTLGATTPSTVVATSVTVSAGTAGAPAITTTGDTNTGIFFPAADTIAFSEGGAESMRIDASGNLGVGVTPSAGLATANYRLLEVGAVGGGAIYSGDNQTLITTNIGWAASSPKYKTTNPAVYYDQSAGQHSWATAPSGTAGNTATFTTRMTLDASGNLGVGVTPSAWSSSYKAFQFARAGVLWGASSANDFYLGNNYYYDGTNLRYINNGFASEYYQASGVHAWRTAASGTAGGVVSLTQAMTLDESGNLKFNSGYGSVATAYGCRAWVNFNGTGTVAIRASGNVSSITDNGTGNYTINFTNAMPDINYATTVNTQGSSTGSIVGEWGLYTSATNAFQAPTTSTFRITTWNSAVSGLADTAYVMATVFR